MITRSDIYKMDEMQKIRLALDPKTRKEILHELAKDNNPVIRTLVAKNPNIGIETQKLLLRDKDKMVLENLAYNPKCDWKILDRLAEHFDGRIREIVAENANTYKETINKLAKDKEVSVKEACLGRNDLSSLAIITLMHEKNRRLRQRALDYAHRKEDEYLVSKDMYMQIHRARIKTIRDEEFERPMYDDSWQY